MANLLLQTLKEFWNKKKNPNKLKVANLLLLTMRLLNKAFSAEEREMGMKNWMGQGCALAGWLKED